MLNICLPADILERTTITRVLPIFFRPEATGSVAPAVRLVPVARHSNVVSHVILLYTKGVL